MIEKTLMIGVVLFNLYLIFMTLSVWTYYEKKSVSKYVEKSLKKIIKKTKILALIFTALIIESLIIIQDIIIDKHIITIPSTFFFLVFITNFILYKTILFAVLYYWLEIIKNDKRYI